MAWSISTRGGATLYQGDISMGGLGTMRGGQFTFGVGFHHHFKERFTASLVANRGRLAARDGFFRDDPVRSLRNFSFNSTFTDFQLNLDLDIWPEARFSPRIGTGFGTVLFDAFPDFFGNSILELTERIKADENEQFNTYAFFIPARLTIRFQPASNWWMESGFQYNFTFTDYLDGVSQAGDPGNNDKYGMLYLGVAYGLPTEPDTDGDGIADGKDHCPFHAGQELLNGCPDSDGDGISDANDICPLVAGSSSLTGCPDTDLDGTPDPHDRCPGEAGPPDAQGCPIRDTDNDNIADHLDECPLVAGPAERRGCPAIDSDRDGILDEDDRCPNTFGQALFRGCPDSDGDGIEDTRDACPNVFGLFVEQGCPSTASAEEEAQVLAMQILYFAPNSADLSNYALLDRIKTFLQAHPTFRLRIHGHADYSGSDESNEYISTLRAERVKRYLSDFGIASERLLVEGFGVRRPISDGTTLSGQAQNRRVEFFLER